MSKGNTYTLKEVQDMRGETSRKNKRLEIMKRNAAASLVIKASQMLQQKQETEDTFKVVNELHKQVQNKDIPMDAFMAVLDGKIKGCQDKVDFLTSLKFKNNGELKRGDESNLKRFTLDLEIAKQEKEDFLAEQEVKKVKEVEPKPVVAKIPKAKTKVVDTPEIRI